MDININNYEEWMIDYVEGNLSKEQQKQFAEFLAYHPELKSELELFQQTKLQPDMNVVFAGKAALKQKETGRVITMGNWVKYTSAIAAALLLFVGIRFFTGNNADEQVAIKKYKTQTIETPFAYDRQTDAIKEKNTVIEKELTQDENTYAQDNKDKQQKKEEPAPVKIQREAAGAETGIELAALKPIRQHISAGLKDALPDVVIVEQEQFAASHPQTDKSKNISLNDNNSIVDWMNDALAMGGEVEGMITSFMNDEKKTVESNSPYKTTSVNILGFNYYSRKKINN